MFLFLIPYDVFDLCSKPSGQHLLCHLSYCFTKTCGSMIWHATHKVLSTDIINLFYLQVYLCDIKMCLMFDCFNISDGFI